MASFGRRPIVMTRRRPSRGRHLVDRCAGSLVAHCCSSRNDRREVGRGRVAFFSFVVAAAAAAATQTLRRPTVAFDRNKTADTAPSYR